MSDASPNQFASLVHLLRTVDRPDTPVRCVVFGGTGAVGGATVMELCRLVLLAARFRKQPIRAEIHATGMSDKEIVAFIQRLYLGMEPLARIEKLKARRHYRFGGLVDLRFSHFHLAVPTESLKEMLDGFEQKPGPAVLEQQLARFFEGRDSPFFEFVRELASPEAPLDGVVVGIPLPSVATYTLDFLDSIASRYGLDHAAANRVKDCYLESFVRGLKTINDSLARHVIIAHTTAVGGMFRVDGPSDEIRTGFAHSALGKLLEDKKYFADKLTRLYLDQGFLVLITAAAIGIDMVEFRVRLPIVRSVKLALAKQIAEAGDAPPIPASDLEGNWGNCIHLYPGLTLKLDDQEPAPLRFGPGRELRADVAIRSGENGLFSVANCTALYNVMKVAIPEELATVIVRQVLFGNEPHRGWFSQGANYYTETDNATFALRVLVSDERLIRGHLGAFAVQAYQALGSATHQARLHELGLCVLLLRLLELARSFRETDDATLRAAVNRWDDFFWETTSRPTFEDLLAIGPQRLARLFGRLCEVRTNVDAGLMLGYDLRAEAVREPGRVKFLSRLATRIRRLLSTITSLGTPIIYTHQQTGEDRLLVGPYVAPLHVGLASADQLIVHWRTWAERLGVPYAVARDWSICNNGFLDLRAHALGSCARVAGPELAAAVFVGKDASELETWLDGLEYDSYFTTCGLVALDYRLRKLWEQIRGRRVELGTRETWKNFFYQKTNGTMVLSPGMVETLRMYNEGLGKVTGTEQLWPGWGYR